MASLDVGKPRLPSLVERLKALEQTKVYDLLAASPLIVWYALCVTARVPALATEVASLDFSAVDLRTLASLASKIATLIFITVLIGLLTFRNTPLAKASGLLPRLAALAGTYLSVGIVLLPPAELSTPLYLASALLVVGGTLFALYSALALGRSLSMMSEARRLVTCGPYALIRHPLYLGEGLALIGLTLQFFSPWALLIFALQCVCQVVRMDNEERVLSGVFPDYASYTARTARLLPHVY